MRLDSPLHSLKGIGPKTEQLFSRIGVYTVGDILLYFPRDYERYPEISGIGELLQDRKNAVFVQVKKAPVTNMRSAKQTTMLDLEEDGHKLRILWYHKPYIRNVVRSGGWYVFYGPVTVEKDLFLMEQPQILAKDDYMRLQTCLQPIYSLTNGLSNHQIVKTVDQILRESHLEMEYLSDDIRQRNGLSEYNFAIQNIHFPESEEACITARKRFVFDEFFFFILGMQLTKEGNRELANDFSFLHHTYAEKVLSHLPYILTNAQKKTYDHIRADMSGACIMQRLIQGDVGSGKTILAFLSMLDAAENGYQAAIMAPTDVLARQHYQKLQELVELNELNIPVYLLTGSITAGQKKRIYEALESGAPSLIVGTHALIQEKVNYGNLALVITDEQHRFGVKQRESFSFKGKHPHIMVMSATPIPRTLAIILYGDLDISVIDEVPAVRKPIKNCVVNTGYRNTAYRFLEKEIRNGHQVYVVCPLVETSELMDGENVIDYAEHLKSVLPSDITVGILHGKMKAADKNEIMEQFLDGKIQILVSTTVIEVGVDVPNATVMMIENAERFGLAQLHQLRGRVGRGDAQSYCIMINGNDKNPKNKRLDILNHSNDGFYIASEDLKLRGPGDFFGIRQSGEFEFKLADIYQDAKVMEAAAYEVSVLLKDDPALKKPENKILRNRLKITMGEDFSLLNL